MHSVKKSSFGVFIALAFVAILSSISAAFAADTPHLVWQRGRTQEVILGGNTQAQLWTLKLVGTNSSPLVFTKSHSTSSQYFVYDIVIPKDFALGDYQVKAIGTATSSVVANVTIDPNVNYDPLYDPKAVGGLAVLAFSILTAFSHRDTQSSQDSDPNNAPGTANSIDNSYHAIRIGRRGRLDAVAFGKRKFVLIADFLRHLSIYGLAARSPLFMRVVADGSYLQSIVGPFALIIPLAGLACGVVAGASSHITAGIIPSSFAIFVAIVVLGIFDSLAGFLAFLSFGIPEMVRGNFTSGTVFRSFIGFGVIWFGIILVAGAMRPLRRALQNRFLWERTGDLLIPALFLGWSVRGMIYSLQGFAHLELPIVHHANQIALIAAGCIVARYLLEETSFQLAPARLEYLSPPTVPDQKAYVPYLSLFFKVFIYLIFVFSFLGLCWQTFATVGIMVIPTLLKLAFKNPPNAPWLYQLLPSGIPAMIYSSLAGMWIVNWIDSLPIFAPDKSRNELVIATLPGLVVGLLRIVGSHPKPGDVKWYLRDKNMVFYTFFGPACIALAALLSYGVFS